MPSKVINSSDFYVIESDSGNMMLKSKWLLSVNCEEMKAGGTMLYESLRDTGTGRVVANAELLRNLDAETKEWMATTFYELLSQTKLKKIARVLPGHVYSRIALESVATRAEAAGFAKFVFRNFANQQEAEKWLLS